jgi:acetylornithine deacetylase/succinyl-diaminopimelate desuccinylase-like protein
LSRCAAGTTWSSILGTRDEQPGIVDVTQDDVVRRIIEFVDLPTAASDVASQRRGAAWLRARVAAAGFATSLRDGPRSPFVIGRLDRANAPTLAVYMMYDTRESTQGHPGPSHVQSLAPLGPCLIGARPIGNKAAIELFLTAVEALHDDPRCPSLILLAEGSEIDGSPGLGDLVAHEPDFQSRTTSVFWPHASQAATGEARLNLAYRGMLGLTMTASGRASGRGPASAAVHSQYRPWVDAPTWRLLAAVESLVTDDGDRLAVSLPPSTWPLPKPPATFDPEPLLATLKVSPGATPPDAKDLWARLALPSVNVELVGTPGPGVGLIQPSASVKLQFRLPPGYPTRTVMDAIRSHLDTSGWADVSIETEYAIDGASTDIEAPVMHATRSMYSSHRVDTDVWPVALSTSPTCAFATLGYDLADGGLGHQDDRRNALVLEDVGSIAGVDRSIAGYATFLTSYTSAALASRAEATLSRSVTTS